MGLTDLFDHEIAERVHLELSLLHLDAEWRGVLLAVEGGLGSGFLARDTKKT